MTDTNTTEGTDDVEALKAEVESQRAHIEKLKKENGKWRVRYRNLQKQHGGQESDDNEEIDATDTQDAETPPAPDTTDDGSAADQTPPAPPQQADQADEATARAAATEAALRTARIRLAFVEANLQRPEPFKDVDLALENVDLGAVKVVDDGTVTGLTDAMDHLAQRYPYLVDDSDSHVSAPDTSELPSGRPAVTQKRTQPANDTVLIKKYPALRRR